MPRVSDKKHAHTAARMNPMPHNANAQDNPRVSPTVPMTSGARALIPRATLYEIPNAVARICVGNNSLPKIPEPVKNPVPKKAAKEAVSKTRAGNRAAANKGTESAAKTDVTNYCWFSASCYEFKS